MDRDEFETIGQQRRQGLVMEYPKQLDRANTAKKRQNRLISSENFDTIPQKSNNWLIPGILAAGLIAVTAVVVGSQLKTPIKEEIASTTASTSTAVAEPTSPTSTAPGAISSDDREQQEQMLLEQAKLLANQGQPQQLAQAIAIAKKLPSNTSVSSQAQSLSAIWSQQILQEAKTKASGGELTEAIALAKLVPEKTKARPEAQKQIKQWQQQQRQTEQKQFAAKVASVSQLPASAPVASLPPPPPLMVLGPLPVTALPPESQSVPPAQAIVPKSKPVSQAQTPVQHSPATPPKSKPVSQAQTPVKHSSATANENKVKSRSASQPKPKTTNTQAQSPAQDPYLNVKIPQVNVPQIQPKTVQSSRTVVVNRSSNTLRNNYGFRNLTVNASTVAIQLRDNVDEDGDYVTLIVNGKVYASNQLILNRGKVFMVDLEPGQNRVDIVGVKDGRGGITLEANVAGIGNINNRPIPEGSTASFIINRK